MRAGDADGRPPPLMVGDLRTWRWAVSDEAAPLRALVRPGMGPGAITALRERWSAEQVAVVSELVAARAKAISKFPERAENLAADREGVEMASSARAAAYKAVRFAGILGPGARVVDACCGIGGDAMAMVEAGLSVTAIDLDERRAWMAGFNAGCETLAADVLAWSGDAAGIHADPSRRAGGQRTRAAEAFEPALTPLMGVVGRARVGAIKLHPGVDASSLPPGELEVISEGGRLTQAVLWTGGAAAHERRATLLSRTGEVHTLAGPPERPYDANDVGAWVHTFDPSVERADLVGLLIAATGLALVHPGAGLLTGGEPCRSPWVTPFRVLEAAPWSLKGTRAIVRRLGAGEIVVKTRGGLVEPDRLSRELRGTGDRSIVLFVVRLGDRPVSIAAERAETTAPPDDAWSDGGAARSGLGGAS